MTAISSELYRVICGWANFFAKTKQRCRLSGIKLPPLAWQYAYWMIVEFQRQHGWLIPPERRGRYMGIMFKGIWLLTDAAELEGEK